MKSSLKKKIIFLRYRLCPIMKNVVFFKSFGGQYNDNPKYISEKLNEINSNLMIVWAISDKSNSDDVPEYVKKVPVDSNECYKYESLSQVIIDNMDGIRGFVSKRKHIFLQRLFKRRDQLNISTWHGTPLKKIGLDVPEMRDYKYMYTSAEYITSGCEYTCEKIKDAFNPIKVKLNGTPRNDLLVNTTKCKKKELKEKLGLPSERKICLFAPTFRNSVMDSGIAQLNSLDINKLLLLLKKKYEGDWSFVIRVHHEVLKNIDVNGLCEGYGDGIVIDGNKHDDMAEYLAVTDVLITDYSSSFFDFLLTRRPCFLLTMDREHYMNDERGVYLSFDELPYKYADDVETLYKLIDEDNIEETKKRIELFLNSIGNIEDGESALRISKEILNYIG